MACRALVGGKRVGNHVHVDGDVGDGGRWRPIVIDGDEDQTANLERLLSSQLCVMFFSPTENVTLML